MSTDFTVTAKSGRDVFNDVVSLSDAITYKIDFTPWQEDNSTITSITWTAESGNVAISGEALTAGVASALLTFSNRGRNLITIVATSATEIKKIWLQVRVKDLEIFIDDYGICT